MMVAHLQMNRQPMCLAFLMIAKWSKENENIGMVWLETVVLRQCDWLYCIEHTTIRQAF